MEGLYPLYKYRGPSSNQFMMQFKKMHDITDKIGYAGTLDPLAEGLLLVAVGREHTKGLQHLSDCDKEYRTTIMLNGNTDSGDEEGEIRKINPKCIPTLERVLEVCEQFEGPQMQVPSNYSAKKVDGRRSYSMARISDKNGQKLEACPIVIHSIQVLSYNYPELEIEVSCSKGTYIRVLGQEIGKALTGAGYLSKLVRTSVGEYGIEDIDWKLSPNKIVCGEK